MMLAEQRKTTTRDQIRAGKMDLQRRPVLLQRAALCSVALLLLWRVLALAAGDLVEKVGGGSGRDMAPALTAVRSSTNSLIKGKAQGKRRRAGDFPRILPNRGTPRCSPGFGWLRLACRYRSPFSVEISSVSSPVAATTTRDGMGWDGMGAVAVA
jgi:hypothetical protein